MSPILRYLFALLEPVTAAPLSAVWPSRPCVAQRAICGLSEYWQSGLAASHAFAGTGSHRDQPPC